MKRCDEVQELVDPIAAGDMAPELAVEAHLASCARCQAALDTARAVEEMLTKRAVPQPPTHFTSRVLGATRRDRWRREQLLDLGFNVTVALLGLAMAAGAVLLVYMTGIGGVASEVIDAGATELARRAAPALPLYGAAAALVATTLAVWWWAERAM